MALPWARLDANIYAHDKFLALLADPSSKKWQAISLYTFGLAWSVGQGTDGKIPKTALGILHGTPTAARLLQKYGLWDENTSGAEGWTIRNFDTRQQLTSDLKTPEELKESQQLGARKGNCIRHHGPACGCWRDTPR